MSGCLVANALVEWHSLILFSKALFFVLVFFGFFFVVVAVVVNLTQVGSSEKEPPLRKCLYESSLTRPAEHILD